MFKKSVAIIGSQWGDEGKGKFVDYLARSATSRIKQLNFSDSVKRLLIRRYQGGANAGHTLVAGDQKYAQNLIPSGILMSSAYNLIDQQVFGDVRHLTSEIKELQNRGIVISPQNLGIASNMHVTLDYHISQDQAAFRQARHTSTGSGIKQTSVDKQNRVGIRFAEFIDEKEFKLSLAEKFPNGIEVAGGIDAFVESYRTEIDYLKDFITLSHQVSHDQNYLFEIWEGAQGIMLDVDVGEYPGTTSSNPSIIPGKTDLRLGAFKLYSSSAGTGNRPFVSQMIPSLETQVRVPWGEFGTKTSKPRDVGWLDAVAGKYAVQAGNIDYLIGTCGDKMELLSQLEINPKIIVGYKLDGKIYNQWDASMHKRRRLKNATPVYEEFQPWKKFQNNGKLTEAAERFVNRFQELVDREFIMYGTGPEATEVIVKCEPWDLL